MPFTPKSATKYTKSADTQKKKRQWADVADNVLAKGQSDASAIKQANAVVKKAKKKAK